MNKLTYILLILSTCILLPTAKANSYIVNNAEQYPYKNLIDRTKEVKIFYSEVDDNIHCYVEVTIKNDKRNSLMNSINKDDFQQKPLTSCLTYAEAKQLLTYSYLQFGQGL